MIELRVQGGYNLLKINSRDLNFTHNSLNNIKLSQGRLGRR